MYTVYLLRERGRIHVSICTCIHNIPFTKCQICRRIYFAFISHLFRNFPKPLFSKGSIPTSFSNVLGYKGVVFFPYYYGG